MPQILWQIENLARKFCHGKRIVCHVERREAIHIEPQHDVGSPFASFSLTM